MYKKYTIATIPTGIKRSQENRRGFNNNTTAAKENNAADAPTKVESGGKNGILSGKLRIPPTKNAVSIRFAFVTLSKVLPKT